MLTRKLILKLILLVLPFAIATLKKEAEKTANPLDDVLVQIGEAVVGLLASGELDGYFKVS